MGASRGVDVDVSDVKELHYITPIDNLRSIFQRGILSHKRVALLPHESVAMLEIQVIRDEVRVPRGRPLHEYVNLYFNARNVMMYKRSGLHRKLCVLRIRPDVLQLEGVVITDRNAASDWRRWGSYPEALAHIDKDRIFAERWDRHDDQMERLRHRSEMCAEALIPDRVTPDNISGIYVSSGVSAAEVRELKLGVPVSVDGYLFFFTARRGAP